MPAFFLLSGMLFRNDRWKERGWKSFLLRRVETLMVPYAFFEVLAILYRHFILRSVTIPEGLWNMISFRCNVGADWFLPAMFLAQIFFFFCVKYLNKTISGILAAAALFCTWYLPTEGLWRVLCRGMLGFGFIVIGNILKMVFSAKHQKRWDIALSAGAFALTAVCAGIGFLHYTGSFYFCRVDNPFLYTLNGMSGLYFVLGISRMIRFRWLQWLGENSLTIMGTHQLVLYTIPGNASPLWVLGMFALIIAIEIPVILCCNRFCPFLVGKTKK